MFGNFLGISFKSWQIFQFNAWTVETGAGLSPAGPPGAPQGLIFCQMISYQGEVVASILYPDPFSVGILVAGIGIIQNNQNNPLNGEYIFIHRKRYTALNY